jgi:hypothetical protein
MLSRLSQFVERQNREESRRERRERMEQRFIRVTRPNANSSSVPISALPQPISRRRYTGRPEFRLSNRMFNHMIAYHAFRLERLSYYCAICCRLLYQNEVYYRQCETSYHRLPCNQWGRPPIVQRNTGQYDLKWSSTYIMVFDICIGKTTNICLLQILSLFVPNTKRG